MSGEIKDSKGRFVKGHPYLPSKKGRNDKKGREYVDAISLGYPPEKIMKMADDIHRLALKQESVGNLLKLMQTMLAYNAGKPNYRAYDDDGAGAEDWGKILSDPDAFGFDKLTQLKKEVRKEARQEGAGTRPLANDTDATGVPGDTDTPGGSE